MVIKAYPSELQDRFIVRLPDGMRAQIARVAAINGRSMNSEIVIRLKMALDGMKALPIPVQQAVDALAANTGCTPEEALTRLVLAGQGKGGTVLNISIAPGTTAKDVHSALEGALRLVSPDSVVLLAKN